MIPRVTQSAAMLFLVASTAMAQTQKPSATYKSPTGATLRLLLDDSNVGPEATVAELTLPPNADSGEHVHGSVEMLYVLSGEYEHIVNGKSQILRPGMAGYVRAPDTVRHKTGPAGAK